MVQSSEHRGGSTRGNASSRLASSSVSCTFVSPGPRPRDDLTVSSTRSCQWTTVLIRDSIVFLLRSLLPPLSPSINPSSGVRVHLLLPGDRHVVPLGPLLVLSLDVENVLRQVSDVLHMVNRRRGKSVRALAVIQTGGGLTVASVVHSALGRSRCMISCCIARRIR